MFKAGDRVVALVTIVCKFARVEHGTVGRVVKVLPTQSLMVRFEHLTETDERDPLAKDPKWNWIICHPTTVKPLHNPIG